MGTVPTNDATGPGEGSGTTAAMMPLRCPQCGVEGLIHYQALGRAIDCHKCACRFIVQRDGQAIPLASLPQVSFACPRCRTTGSVPAPLASRGTQCPRCKLPMALGPDQQLHPTEVAMQMRRDASARQRKANRTAQAMRQQLRNADGGLRWGRIGVLGSVVLSLLVATAFAAQSFFDNSPETFAARMIRLCLADNSRAAERYLADDELQRIEFERWHMRYLSSLRNEFRPAGEKVEIDVQPIGKKGQRLQLQATLNSPTIGQRVLLMNWEEVEGRWVFDATGTLAATDRPKPPVRDKKATRASVPSHRPVSPHLIPSRP